MLYSHIATENLVKMMLIILMANDGKEFTFKFLLWQKMYSIFVHRSRHDIEVCVGAQYPYHKFAAVHHCLSLVYTRYMRNRSCCLRVRVRKSTTNKILTGLCTLPLLAKYINNVLRSYTTIRNKTICAFEYAIH